MATLGKVVPSLFTAKSTWKFENDEVILDYVRYWLLDATRAGLLEFTISFDAIKGTYFCTAVR